jgi:hypothetical protein
MNPSLVGQPECCRVAPRTYPISLARSPRRRFPLLSRNMEAFLLQQDRLRKDMRQRLPSTPVESVAQPLHECCSAGRLCRWRIENFLKSITWFPHDCCSSYTATHHSAPKSNHNHYYPRLILFRRVLLRIACQIAQLFTDVERVIKCLLPNAKLKSVLVSSYSSSCGPVIVFR